jgi:hypothetical protein
VDGGQGRTTVRRSIPADEAPVEQATNKIPDGPGDLKEAAVQHAHPWPPAAASHSPTFGKPNAGDQDCDAQGKWNQVGRQPPPSRGARTPGHRQRQQGSDHEEGESDAEDGEDTKRC